MNFCWDSASWRLSCVNIHCTLPVVQRQLWGKKIRKNEALPYESVKAVLQEEEENRTVQNILWIIK